MSWEIGAVGHFGTAVRDPKRSAKWWIEKIGLRHKFDFDGGVVVGNDAVDIVLFKGQPHPDTMYDQTIFEEAAHACLSLGTAMAGMVSPDKTPVTANVSVSAFMRSVSETRIKLDDLVRRYIPDDANIFSCDK